MNSWDEVLAFADDRKFLRVLFPSSLEMMVEDGLTKPIQDSSWDYIGLYVLFFEGKNTILDFLDLCILAGCTPFQEVLFLKRMMQETLFFANWLRLLFFFLIISSIFVTRATFRPTIRWSSTTLFAAWKHIVLLWRGKWLFLLLLLLISRSTLLVLLTLIYVVCSCLTFTLSCFFGCKSSITGALFFFLLLWWENLLKIARCSVPGQ